MNKCINEAYTVLSDGATFSPTAGSKIVFAVYDPATPWTDIRDAKGYQQVDLGEYVQLLFAKSDRMFRQPEINTILAALRLWQRAHWPTASQSSVEYIDQGEEEIANNAGAQRALTAAEIDALCDYVNFGDR